MKKIHKKIGAMALAGMMVLGGGVLSGVSNVHAASSKSSIKQLGSVKQEIFRANEKVFEKYGYRVRAVAVSDSSYFHRKAVMDDFIKDYIKKNNNKGLKKRLLDVPVDCGNSEKSLKLEMKSIKDKNLKLARIVCDDMDFLLIRK